MTMFIVLTSLNQGDFLFLSPPEEGSESRREIKCFYFIPSIDSILVTPRKEWPKEWDPGKEGHDTKKMQLMIRSIFLEAVVSPLCVSTFFLSIFILCCLFCCWEKKKRDTSKTNERLTRVNRKDRMKAEEGTIMQWWRRREREKERKTGIKGYKKKKKKQQQQQNKRAGDKKRQGKARKWSFPFSAHFSFWGRSLIFVLVFSFLHSVKDCILISLPVLHSLHFCPLLLLHYIFILFQCNERRGKQRKNDGHAIECRAKGSSGNLKS